MNLAHRGVARHAPVRRVFALGREQPSPGSLAERHAGHQHRATRAHHPDTVATAPPLMRKLIGVPLSRVPSWPSTALTVGAEVVPIPHKLSLVTRCSSAFDGTITLIRGSRQRPGLLGGCAMKTLRHIMRHGFLFMLQRDTTVADACRMMAAHNVGIIAVLDGERLCGVFSERDVARRVVDRRLDPARTRLEEVMTAELVVADADEDYQSAMNKMDQANIRHLPVVSGDRLLSMLSIRDLMRVAIEERGAEIEYLKEYLYQVPPSVER